MRTIYESDNFSVVTLADENDAPPHISRMDGGHLIITPKTTVSERQDLSPKQAIELMRLTCVVGKAFVVAMKRMGVEIGRVNYQDNGNWSVNKPEGPRLHVHIYGRAIQGEKQKYGEALHHPKPDSGFYDENKSLTEQDIVEIKSEIEKMFEDAKYSNESWCL